MKPIIGIITRNSFSSSGNKIDIIYSDIIKSIINSGGIPIGINNPNIDLYLDLCHGFILQGGDDIDSHNLEVLAILKKINKPVLGICLGMQEMAYFYGGTLYDIKNHKKNIIHNININKDSLLYKIIGKEKIIVNSRHNSAIKNTKLLINAISDDNIVEGVEDKNHKFFIGLQWHPENIYDDSLPAKKIFDYFIKICHD